MIFTPNLLINHLLCATKYVTVPIHLLAETLLQVLNVSLGEQHQMSRLLDVRFAQSKTHEQINREVLGDFGLALKAYNDNHEI